MKGKEPTTRKDYELIARGIEYASNAVPKTDHRTHTAGKAALAHAAGCIADLLEENPRFDRVRFLKDCGI